MRQDDLLIPLVKVAKEGDQQTIYALWQDLKPVWRKWKRMTHLPQMEEEDLEQQSYLILLEAVEKYDLESEMHFAGFYKVRLHIWRRRIAKKVTFESVETSEGKEKMNRLTDYVDIALEVEASVMGKGILERINQLEELDQQILLLSLIKGKASSAIAKQLGCSATSVRQRKKRGLQKIKEFFKQ